MSHRRSAAALACGAALIAGSCLGCGPSEEEHKAKLNEVLSLKAQLDSEQAQSKKTKADLDLASERVEQLKKQLAAAGVDVTNLGSSAEQQARALEDYRRRIDQIEQIRKRFNLLRDKLESVTKLGALVTTRGNRMVIVLPGDTLFELNRETLKREGQAILLKVADVIKNDAGLSARSFQIAGHTDGSPLKATQFKDNLGLSVMRAREVLALLVLPADKGGGGLSAQKWSAAGHGDADPVAPNDTPEHKQSNRRCEIVVLPAADEVIDLKALAAPAPPQPARPQDGP